MIVSRLRQLALEPKIRQEQEFLLSSSDHRTTRLKQISQFNDLWSNYLTHVPRFREMLAREDVPRTFRDWEQFQQVIPVMRRRDVQDRGAEYFLDASISSEGSRVSGGSTGEPFRMPGSKAERNFERIAQWVGRSWYSVQPSDRLFLVWGHFHLLGDGWRKHIRRVERQVKDAVLSYRRASAYDVSDQALRQMGEDLLAWRPDYIVGATSALVRLAKVNRHRQADFSALNLKVVLATAEAFREDEDREYLAQVFACPVGMEYGSSETGVLAYTTPEGIFRVFWNRYFVEVCPVSSEVLVTSLYPRRWPLVRYAIGDRAMVRNDQDRCGALFLNQILGRVRSPIDVAGRFTVHPVALQNIAKGIRGVREYQITVWEDVIEISARSSQGVTFESIRKKMEDRARQIFASDFPLLISQMEKPVITAAGKTPVIVCDTRPYPGGHGSRLRHHNASGFGEALGGS